MCKGSEGVEDRRQKTEGIEHGAWSLGKIADFGLQIADLKKHSSIV